MVQRTAQKPTTPGSKKAGAKPHSGLDRDALLKAYEKMSRIRAFEDRLHEENATGDIPGFIHLYSGQEAIAVGVCENLSDADYIGSTHRGHGHCIAKGCDLNGMMAEIFGKDDGLCRGKGGSMHIADLSVGMLGANAIVGGAPSLAIGAALSGKTLRNGVIAASFTGDGGSNQGTVFEAMNMAVVLDLPIVFVIENNGFGEATGTDYAVGAPEHRRARRILRHACRQGGRHRLLRGLRRNGGSIRARQDRRRPHHDRGGGIPLARPLRG